MGQTAGLVVILTVFFGVGIMACADSGEETYASVPVKGMVTMVDLGAHKCVPCKMMAPILEKLTKAYKGKAAIVFIDVWQDRSQARKYGIRAIPTQIFFDKSGKEVYRHVGFMGEDAIVNHLKKMGVDEPSAGKA
jgi:thioredoxin 1